jgi:hypothetical protein
LTGRGSARTPRRFIQLPPWIRWPANPVQLQACARRIASDLLADFGHVETTLLKPDGKILSARLDSKAGESLELWMRDAGLPVPE